jgi:hypothetical protein
MSTVEIRDARTGDAADGSVPPVGSDVPIRSEMSSIDPVNP